MLSRLALHAAVVISVVALPFVLPVVALGDVLASTFGPADEFSSTTQTTIGPSEDRAARFVAGSTARVTAVRVALQGTDRVVIVTVRISPDLAGSPGAPLASVSVPLLLSTTAGVHTITFSTPPAVAAGQAYWLWLSAEMNSQWKFNNQGAQGTLKFRSGGAATWSSAVSPTLPAFSVEGSAAAACCTPGGCAVIAAADCAALGGVSVDAVCTPSPCSSVGACCTGLSCSVRPQGQCVGGSRFLGSGSTCVSINGSNPCCVADVNNSGQVSVQDVFDFLTRWFGNCP